MRKRIAATLTAACLLVLGLPAVAGATCTEYEIFEGQSGCLENAVCPVVTAVITSANCIE